MTPSDHAPHELASVAADRAVDEEREREWSMRTILVPAELLTRSSRLLSEQVTGCGCPTQGNCEFCREYLRACDEIDALLGEM